MLNIPNFLTLLRITLIPVLIIFYFLPCTHRGILMISVFILAMFTDWLDGYLARRMNAVSALGKFLDPVADKLMVSTTLVLMVSDLTIQDRVFHPMLFAVATCIIIGREIVISALREWMATIGDRCIVSVGLIGKVKTLFQMVSIGLMLYAKPIMGVSILKIGEISFYIAAILTLWSMLIYFGAAMPFLVSKE